MITKQPYLTPHRAYLIICDVLNDTLTSVRYHRTVYLRFIHTLCQDSQYRLQTANHHIVLLSMINNYILCIIYEYYIEAI